jgi:hypothetical protein
MLETEDNQQYAPDYPSLPEEKAHDEHDAYKQFGKS